MRQNSLKQRLARTWEKQFVLVRQIAVKEQERGRALELSFDAQYITMTWWGGILTVTVGDHVVWSSELAPTRIFGGCPVSLAKLSSAFAVNSFRSSTPTQSGHRSCSRLKDTKVETSSRALSGVTNGIDTLRARFSASRGTTRAKT